MFFMKKNNTPISLGMGFVSRSCVNSTVDLSHNIYTYTHSFEHSSYEKESLSGPTNSMIFFEVSFPLSFEGFELRQINSLPLLKAQNDFFWTWKIFKSNIGMMKMKKVSSYKKLDLMISTRPSYIYVLYSLFCLQTRLRGCCCLLKQRPVAHSRDTTLVETTILEAVLVCVSVVRRRRARQVVRSSPFYFSDARVFSASNVEAVAFYFTQPWSLTHNLSSSMSNNQIDRMIRGLLVFCFCAVLRMAEMYVSHTYIS